MKVIYAVMFSLLSLAGILQDLTVYISFKTNQEYIAITMCTSRDDPDNTCQGSCYLNKQLEMVHDHEQNSDRQAPPTQKEHITYYLEEIIDEIDPSYTTQDVIYTDYNAVKGNRGFPSDTFEPPRTLRS